MGKDITQQLQERYKLEAEFHTALNSLKKRRITLAGASNMLGYSRQYLSRLRGQLSKGRVVQDDTLRHCISELRALYPMTDKARENPSELKAPQHLLIPAHEDSSVLKALHYLTAPPREVKKPVHEVEELPNKAPDLKRVSVALDVSDVDEIKLYLLEDGGAIIDIAGEKLVMPSLFE
jgi:hypothetical protein